jgi:hypothetical protein
MVLSGQDFHPLLGVKLFSLLKLMEELRNSIPKVNDFRITTEGRVENLYLRGI